MCDPASFALATAVGATALQTVGTYQQAQAQKSAARYQADVSAEQARDAIARGEIEEQRIRERGDLFLGTQRSRLSRSGVALTEGSVLDTLADTAGLVERDALFARQGALRESAGFSAQAGLQRATAGSIRPGLSASTSLLGGSGQVADMWYRYNQSGAWR